MLRVFFELQTFVHSTGALLCVISLYQLDLSMANCPGCTYSRSDPVASFRLSCCRLSLRVSGYGRVPLGDMLPSAFLGSRIVW